MYSANSKRPGCRNLGRLLFNYADIDGRQIVRPVFCRGRPEDARRATVSGGIKISGDGAIISWITFRREPRYRPPNVVRPGSI